MTVRRRDLERGLAHAERVIALAERCRPTNARHELERVLEGWRRGHERAPAWQFAPAAGLADVCTGLEQVARHAETCCGWGRLYADRARELAVEAELAERVGTPGFAAQAARRYPVEPGQDGETARTWAEAWAVESPSAERGEAVRSDDEHRPESLISAMRRAVGEHRLPFRVVVHDDLLSAAATGDGIIVVRGGARYRRFDVERIVRHEIEGHALPRTRARSESSALFSVGTAGGSDDEEGRALLLEERSGCLGAERRAELGRRHLAAIAVRRAADFVETVRLLLGLGADVEQAVLIANRVHRGGGLAREIVYLTALARVGRLLVADPEAERWLERGRIAVGAVPVLRELGEPPELMRARAA